jgi:phosphoribosyl 1,2-cyclic phosphate phosphodiesterase
MKIKFLGTGAAEGFPAMFCSCPNCQAARSLGESEVRTRTQVIIDDDLSIDFPPEAYVHSLKFGVNLSNLKYLIVTHSHMDHFYSHDFILRGYKYAALQEELLTIYGNDEVKKVFDECTRRELKEEVAPHICLNVIKPYQTFYAGDYKIITIPAQHSLQEEALLFYVERGGKGYLHLHDSGMISDEALAFLAKKKAKACAVAFDCTFLDNSNGLTARHMSIEENMLVKQKLKELGVIDDDTKLIITHFSHNANPTRSRLKDIEKTYNVIAAYDGLQVEI